MLPDFEQELENEIARYERQELISDQLKPSIIDPEKLLNNINFIRINALAEFWKNGNDVHFTQYVNDFVVSAHSYEDYLTFVLTGNPKQISVFISVSTAEITKGLLSGAFPGIALREQAVTNLGTSLKSRFDYMGMISGIPSDKNISQKSGNASRVEPHRLERVIRGMKGTSWVYVVQAYPRPQSWVVAERKKLLDKIAFFASISRQQLQKSTQISSGKTKHDTETISEIVSGEKVNKRAEYAAQLLEREIKRLEKALSLGRWQTAIYFGATDEKDEKRLASLLNGVLSGPDSFPDPIRLHFCNPKSTSAESKFNTYLSSDEVALLIQPPKEEVPGYGVTDLAKFDVEFTESPDKDLVIGQIQWDGKASGKNYQLRANDLSRHGVVFGVTGSGKTTTLLHILNQLAHKPDPVPFLVIEPAKTEYRALLGKIIGDTATGPLPTLRVYTLGNDNIAPFRLNPFEFDTSELPGNAPVLTHIDFLKSVFNAAFILYAPMPYVLEMALHEIYEDKGWNLATGTNVRMPHGEWAKRMRYPIFPTLTDLIKKIEVVTTRLGYEAKIEQDVIAGLKARIGSLRLGAKGLMLDTPRGVPTSRLLAKPTVLELENIGNDDEKTFIMGLLLTRIFGYCRLQATEGKLSEGLKHVLVIEEAHRLLKNTSTTVDVESANLRAHAIETFINMLSEIRHYGEGVLVAEQIPSKLTPDVIKNTNLKLIHRLLAQDDRDLLGSTMNMDEGQRRYLSTLLAGDAVVFSEGDDHPYLVEVEDFKKSQNLSSPTDEALLGVTEKHILLAPYLLVEDYSKFGIKTERFGVPDPIIYQFAQQFLSRDDSRSIWAKLIIKSLYNKESLAEIIDQLRQQIVAAPGHLSTNQAAEALLLIVVLGIAIALQERGVERGWMYPATDSLRQSLTAAITTLIRTNDINMAVGDLDRFAQVYKDHLKREYGPHPGCFRCEAKCTLLPETSQLVSRFDIGQIESILRSSAFKDKKEKYVAINNEMFEAVKLWLGGSCDESKAISYCASLVIASRMKLADYMQADFARNIAEQ